MRSRWRVHAPRVCVHVRIHVCVCCVLVVPCAEWKEWEEPFAVDDGTAFEDWVGPTDVVHK